jgi:hypothetical protein
MPHRGWRNARDLAAALAALALVQLVLSAAIAGSRSAGMLAAEAGLFVLLGGLALVAHLRLQALLSGHR